MSILLFFRARRRDLVASVASVSSVSSVLSAVAAVALLWTMPLAAGETATPQSPASWPGADLFTNGARNLRLEIPPEGVSSLRADSREYVRATLRDGETVYENVAVHLKGSTGSFRPLDDKPSLTLDFNRFTGSQRYHGLRRIYLNNSVEDPSYLNEEIGAEMFRAAGVPAPRVTHALVELNGRKLGLYVLKEGFTEDFLSCWFRRVDGNLYDTDLGHDVDRPMKRNSGLGPKHDSQADLAALAAAALEPDMGRRWQRLQGVLDVDRFLSFMAMEVMICHRDGYSFARNNFRIYHDMDTDRIIFLPAGMDQLFGKADLPWKPYLSGIVAKAVMETPEGKQRYRERFQSLFTSVFKVKALNDRADQIVFGLRPSMGNKEFKALEEAAAELKKRIAQRQAWLDSELSQPEPALREFKNGVAVLSGWKAVDAPPGTLMEKTKSPDGILALRIPADPKSLGSWRMKALLKRRRTTALRETSGRGIARFRAGAANGRFDRQFIVASTGRRASG
jgi:spore coat protein H